jgi:PAS domain S-box-containing protein
MHEDTGDFVSAQGEGGEIEFALREWRTRTLYVFLLLVAAAGLPSYGYTIWNAVRNAQMPPPLLWVYLAVYLAFVTLAVSPRLDFRLRAWAFLLLAYVNAAASFTRLGLAGSGRLYLIAMPIVATLLVSMRSGYITACLSLAMYGIFALLAHLGLLGGWLALRTNPLTLTYWLEAGAALAVFLVALVMLVARAYGLQVGALTTGRRAMADLERTAQALKEREERLDLVMRGTSDGIWDWNLETGEVYFSPRWKAMLGYEEGDIPHHVDAWRDLVHPDDLDRAMASIQEHLAGLTPLYTLEHRLRHKDGSYRWILARGVSLRDAGGQVYRMAGSHTDITERKRAEEALQLAYQTMGRRVEERTKELGALNAISGVVSRSLDLKEILNDALDQTLQVMHMDLGLAFRLEQPEDDPEDGSYLSLLAHRGVSEEFQGRVNSLPLRNSMVERAAREGRPLAWPAADYPNLQARQAVLKEGIRLGITVPLLVKGRLLGAMSLGARETRSVTAEELSLLAAVGQQVGLAVENARLYESERERYQEAERRRQVAEGMREILAVLNSKQSLEAMLDFIVTQACRVLSSDAASLLRWEDKEGQLKIQSACGLDADYVARLRSPAGQGGAGRALAERRPIAVPDMLAAAARTTPEAVPPEPQRTLLEGLIRRYRAILSVPLIVKDEGYGAITLYYSRPHEFSEEEQRLAMMVAHQAALAIEAARLREQAEQAATAAERSRLARELHDSVTQGLYSVTLYAEAAARLLDEGNRRTASDYLRELRDTAQEALREMRLLIFELRPPELEKIGLVAALQARLKAVEARAGMQAEIHVEGGDTARQVPIAVQQEVYHLIQEALNNVLKHARARQVRVRLEFRETILLAQVSDDGQGFQPAGAQETGGLGIAGMQERAQRVGGALKVESTPGEGARVTLEVPLGQL